MVTRVARFAPGLAAAVVLGIVVTTSQLPDVARVVAIACIIASLVFAIAIRRVDIRTHSAIVTATAAVTAAGETRAGAPYAVACILFALVAVGSFRGARARLPAIRATRRAALVLVLAGASVAVFLALGLPPLGAFIEDRVVSLANDYEAADSVGFSPRMRVGSMQGLLTSDRVVMRVHGALPEYLRGAVYDTYEARAWTRSQKSARTVTDADAPERDTTTRIVFARGAPAAGGPEPRWFLPANACDLHTSSGRIAFDETGIARPEGAADAISFRLGCKDAAVFAEPRPQPSDLGITPGVRVRIEPIAKQWTDGATTDREKLEAIVRELHRFRYSLDAHLDDRIDPVVDFLTEKHEGHCELFASAMALTARSAGIPARVVTGYRVVEVNAISGSGIVRERNAHAWVETWIEGSWHAWDPTPLSEMGLPTKPSFAGAIADIASAALDAAIDAWRFLAAGALALGLAFLTRDRWTGVFRRRRGAPAAHDARPLPCFSALEVALARAGHARDVSEPLEHFAMRLVASDVPWSREVADALVAYAGLRYGGIGEERAVAALVDRATARIG